MSHYFYAFLAAEFVLVGPILAVGMGGLKRKPITLFKPTETQKWRMNYRIMQGKIVPSQAGIVQDWE